MSESPEIIIRVDDINETPRASSLMRASGLTFHEIGLVVGMSMAVLDGLKRDLMQTIPNEFRNDFFAGLGLGLMYEPAIKNGTTRLSRSKE